MWVWGLSLAGIAGLNPVGSMDYIPFTSSSLSILIVVCGQVKSLHRAYHLSIGILPNVVCVCVCVCLCVILKAR